MATILREVPIEAPEAIRIWQTVPDFQYPVGAPPASDVVLGMALASTLDAHGKPRLRPERLEVCDISLRTRTRLWQSLALGELVHAKDDEWHRTLSSAEAAFELDVRRCELSLYGNVYPSGSPLGAVAEHFAGLRHAVAVVQAERRADRYDDDIEMHALLVTDDPALYGAFAPQALVCLYKEDALVQSNLDGLATGLRGKPSTVDLSVRWQPRLPHYRWARA